MKKIMTFSVTCKHKTDLYKKYGIKITTSKRYVTMFWYYLLKQHKRKKLGRKVGLEIMPFSFIKNYSTNLPQL